MCLCPDLKGMSKLPCCLKGAAPNDCRRQCRHVDECEPEPCAGSTGSTDATAASSSGAGGQGGAGGSSEGECDEPSDCVAVDPLCGTVTCENHQCIVDIKVGPIASQLRGDCRRRDCDVTGQVVTVDDPSDWYNDGKECTFDHCLFDPGKQQSEPVNEPVWDGFKCPETGVGVCSFGNCVECVDGIAKICGSGFACDAYLCVPDACMQNKNGGMDWPLETGVDCGGQCYPCFSPQGCKVASDCADGICSGGKCALPTHSDGIKNDNETGVDCGCDNCALCPDGFECETWENCQSLVCWAGKCQEPKCNDGRQNGDETGVDCGASCSNACP